MFKRTILAAATVFALVVSTQAQESATLVLRSGEKVTGQLVDMGGVGFTVRVNAQERQIPTNDVSVIDFTGNGDVSEADLNRGQAVWLRNGQTINGQLHDIAGTSPLKITLKTPSGDRDFASSEIGRIVLSRPSSAVGTSGSSSSAGIPEGTGVAVPGNAAWTPTGLTVRKGDRLSFSATGEVRLSNDAADVANANGSRAGRKVASAPVPDAAAGALVARVGNSAAFPIGENQTVAMPANGQLFLGINDDHLADNQGGYRVTVQRATNPRR
jgi:small nuclear ribonucleoprotein (snRNP)-like protein